MAKRAKPIVWTPDVALAHHLKKAEEHLIEAVKHFNRKHPPDRHHDFVERLGRVQERVTTLRRGCADAADKGELGVDQQQLLVNGDLMREAADELAMLIPKEEPFKSFSDEMMFNLVRAEAHINQACDLLFKRGGKRRSIWYRI